MNQKMTVAVKPFLGKVLGVLFKEEKKLIISYYMASVMVTNGWIVIIYQDTNKNMSTQKEILVKLKPGTTLTATHESGSFWKIDDSFIFTDNGISASVDGKKIFSLKDHVLSGAGFSEDLFELLV